MDECEHASTFRRVLVVDDEGALQFLVRAILEHEDYMVDVAHNGLEAWDRVCATRYDAIVCDVRMPEMDGPTFYGHLAQLDPAQAERLVFITGADLDAATRERIRGRRLLYKPFDIGDLENAVNTIACCPIGLTVP